MSSGSESDDDYVPEEPEKLSEEESADEETEKQYENEIEQKSNKRKVAQETGKGTKKRKTKNTRGNTNEEEEEDEAEEKPKEEELDPEEQKKKEDDLWAMFLDGTDTKTKPKQPTTTKESTSAVTTKSIANNDKPDTNNKKVEDAKEKERRIFEFAGETIVVENDVIKERIKTGERPATLTKLPTRASTGGGLSGVLGALNKKNKLSTLEKSKLDWTTYKKEEGIEEEVHSHNKGKQGYLERRDFLERADLRQYEIERELRMGKRSNR